MFTLKTSLESETIEEVWSSREKIDSLPIHKNRFSTALIPGIQFQTIRSYENNIHIYVLRKKKRFGNKYAHKYTYIYIRVRIIRIIN